MKRIVHCAVADEKKEERKLETGGLILNVAEKDNGDF